MRGSACPMHPSWGTSTHGVPSAPVPQRGHEGSRGQRGAAAGGESWPVAGGTLSPRGAALLPRAVGTPESRVPHGCTPQGWDAAGGGGQEGDMVAWWLPLPPLHGMPSLPHLGTAGLVWRMLLGDPGGVQVHRDMATAPHCCCATVGSPTPSHVDEGTGASRRARCPAAFLRPVPAVFAFIPGK